MQQWIRKSRIQQLLLDILSEKIRINTIRIEEALSSRVVGIGSSAMLMQVTALVQQNVLHNLAAQYGGKTWQIVFGVAYQAVPFAFIPLQNLLRDISQRSGPVTIQNSATE